MTAAVLGSVGSRGSAWSAAFVRSTLKKSMNQVSRSPMLLHLWKTTAVLPRRIFTTPAQRKTQGEKAVDLIWPCVATWLVKQVGQVYSPLVPDPFFKDEPWEVGRQTSGSNGQPCNPLQSADLLLGIVGFEPTSQVPEDLSDDKRAAASIHIELRLACSVGILCEHAQGLCSLAWRCATTSHLTDSCTLLV